MSARAPQTAGEAARPAKDPGAPIAGAEFLDPVAIAGLLTMIVNDSLLRPNWPSWWTGKLSDFGILMLFPFVLSATSSLVLAAVAWARGRSLDPRPTRARFMTAVVISGLGLTAVNVSTTLRDLYVELLYAVDVFHHFPVFRYTLDPTDLVALVILPLVGWYGWRRVGRARPTTLERP